MNRCSKKCATMGVKKGRRRRLVGDVVPAVRPDTMRVPARKKYKCPMYIVPNSLNGFLALLGCNTSQLSGSRGIVSHSLMWPTRL